MNRPGATLRTCLNLTQLESRENPSIPVGLSAIPYVNLWGQDVPLNYTETHDIVRTETNTVTVDQVGTGSAGTFTIDVVGSAYFSDTLTVSGSADGTSLIGSGSQTNEVSYHLVISGGYADGVFTITSETYTETGSYMADQETTWTYSNPWEDSYQWDTNNSGNYTLSWSAATDESGELAYTSYSSSSTDTAHWHEHTTWPDGLYSEHIYDVSRTVETTGNGDTADYTGSESWYQYDYDSGELWEDEWTNPLSGSEYLNPIDEPTYDWQWRAGTSDATNYTFHGVAEESADLTATAVWHGSASLAMELDVTSFNSTSHSAISEYVIDDEPGVPESGTGSESFHRDEQYSYVNDVTGSGSYHILWPADGAYEGTADADYHAIETGSFAVANRYTLNDDHTTGYDDETGEPYDLLFNFDRISTGSGSTTITHDYHDGGDGLELTGMSLVGSGSSDVSIHSWGTRNGLEFDDTSLIPENWSTAVSLTGETGPVTTADGLEDAFPLKGMTTAPLMFFTGQPWPPGVPTTPVGGTPGQIQDWYNKKVIQIGEQGKKKGANALVKKTILEAIQDNNPGNPFPKPSGLYTFEKGNIFAQAMGIDKELAKRQESQLKTYKQIWQGAQMGATVVEITYAVDQANQNPRSGNLIASAKFVTTYTGTFNGQPITRKVPVHVDNLQMHDAKLERMKFQGSP